MFEIKDHFVWENGRIVDGPFMKESFEIADYIKFGLPTELMSMLTEMDLSYKGEKSRDVEIVTPDGVIKVRAGRSVPSKVHFGPITGTIHAAMYPDTLVVSHFFPEVMKTLQSGRLAIVGGEEFQIGVNGKFYSKLGNKIPLFLAKLFATKVVVQQ